MSFDRVFEMAIPLLNEGLKVTLIVSLISIAIGLVIGFLTCLCGRSKSIILRGIAAVYVWVIRGTPMIVQAFLVFFSFPQVMQLFVSDFKIAAFTAGIITLSLNAGAYMSEIFRGGIQAVSIGQVEAARSLGLSQSRTMMKIVLPQAFKISLPSLVNQFIITIKDSSILSVIGLADIVNRAKIYVGKTYDFFPTYTMVAVYYLVVISILMVLSKFLEKKINYDKKQ